MGAFSEAVGIGLSPVLRHHAIARASRHAAIRGPVRPPGSAAELAEAASLSSRGGCRPGEAEAEEATLDGVGDLATSVSEQYEPITKSISSIVSEVSLGSRVEEEGCVI